MPKGIILVQRSDKTGQTYAISFGGAHFNVDSYCDREFGFDFACRVKIKHTKLTSTINSNSKRNKTISSYKDFDHLEINSGESYTGTSVNPARSIGPAIFAGGDALASLWVFIVGPFVGAALAAVIYKLMAKKD